MPHPMPVARFNRLHPALTPATAAEVRNAHLPIQASPDQRCGELQIAVHQDLIQLGQRQTLNFFLTAAHNHLLTIQTYLAVASQEIKTSHGFSA
jgi:hypothetical protein